MRSTRLRLFAAIGALTAGLMAAFTVPASAVTPTSVSSGYVLLADSAPTVSKQLWVAGHFEVTGAPILPVDSPPDGWLCHLLISCRPGVLAGAGLSDDDPAPIAQTREQAPVGVECEFGLGNWFKVHFTRGGRTESGWVAADAVDVVDSGRDVFQCAAFIDW